MLKSTSFFQQQTQQEKLWIIIILVMSIHFKNDTHQLSKSFHQNNTNIINRNSLGFGHSHQFHNTHIVEDVKTITGWMWRIISETI